MDPGSSWKYPATTAKYMVPYCNRSTYVCMYAEKKEQKSVQQKVCKMNKSCASAGFEPTVVTSSGRCLVAELFNL